ncbi:MAG: peptidogalycan biosysnthesis protein [Burkholderiales bacterium]
MQLRVLESLAEVGPVQWNALAGETPVLQYAFLHALHESGCAAPATGWTPRYLSAWQDDVLVGAQIRNQDWLLFERCYRNTYRERRSTLYLNRDFFTGRSSKSMPPIARKSTTQRGASRRARNLSR